MELFFLKRRLDTPKMSGMWAGHARRGYSLTPFTGLKKAVVGIGGAAVVIDDDIVIGVVLVLLLLVVREGCGR